MNFADDYKIKAIVKKISEELNIPEKTVLLAYTNFWKFIRSKIEDLPLKEELTEEEFKQLQVSFNLPSLGKLSTNYHRVTRMNKKIINIKKKKNDKA